MTGGEWTAVDKEADSMLSKLQFEKTFLLFDLVEIKSVGGEFRAERCNTLRRSAECSAALIQLQRRGMRLKAILIQESALELNE